jgi:hypothetical protein
MGNKALVGYGNTVSLGHLEDIGAKFDYLSRANVLREFQTPPAHHRETLKDD